jgi:phage terminase small subunit
MDGDAKTKPKKPRKKTERRTSRIKDVGQPPPHARGIARRRLGDEDINRPLTERQRLFVNHLVRDKLNQSAAARQAGLSCAPGSLQALMKNAKIAHAIAVEREEFARASQMTKKKVIDGFMEAIDMARLKADPMVMVAGWREVAKMCGFYEPTKHKLEVSVNGQVVIQKLQQLNDEQLLALADGRSDAIEGEFSVVEPGEG